MIAYHEFLTQLLDHGRIVFCSAKAPRDRPSPRAVAILANAFELRSLSVAGPDISFDLDVACAAAELVRQAAWAVVCRDARVADLARRLTMPMNPSTPSHHLSADLLLRYLPQIARRARGFDPSDPLIGLLTTILRKWPLSGVLSDVREGPNVRPDFGGHPGLLLLYAERLIGNDRPSWRPDPPGKAWDFYELALQEHGQSAPDAPVGRSAR